MRWPLLKCRRHEVVTPGAAVPARSRSFVPSVPAPEVNRPESSALPAPSERGRLVSDVRDQPCRQTWACTRNALPGLNTMCRRVPRALSRNEAPPSPWRSIPPSPAAHSRSRWWRRPKSQSGDASAPPETTGDGCRRYAASCPAGGDVTTLAMNSPLRLPLHQPSALQRLLDPCVAQVDLVLLRQLLVKMAHVQVEVLLPVQIQNLLGLGLRHPLAARHTTPTI